jgi:hypothetical protein
VPINTSKEPETILVSQELLNDEKENQNTLSNIPNNIDENNLVPDLQQETGSHGRKGTQLSSLLTAFK